MQIKKSTILLLLIAVLCGSCKLKKNDRNDPYIIRSKKIIIDGDTSDWKFVKSHKIVNADQLWVDEDLEAKNWDGLKDLNVSWSVVWEKQKLFFLFRVKDDIISDFTQEFTWLNDCIEIHLDPENRGGDRIEGINAGNALEDRLGKKMYGSEMHFVPSQPPMIYVDDSRGVFYKDSMQNEYFKTIWKGQAITKYTNHGYLMEIAFSIPGSVLKSGKMLGLDIAVCDDDGNGRESLLVWSGYKGPFWITMDYFNKMKLE